ncbi:hypothetical protein GSY74_09490 [Sulfurovum sp. bin170]|uniref:hypothetical protein n=1 Tax=Sulfurovum sp. bin170 TaxID=2695268 RepID=UPI0013DF735E|nr:hypothetical protein [Sulfurovum sp. bin170]NEW61514.1 hypothetical protein [Sulfurovum sp. bin170]
MSIFNFNKKTQTKMFVSELSAPKKASVIAKSAGDGVVSKGGISTIISEIAPELIEEGFKVLSSTIAGFTEDYKSETVVRKNINGDEREDIFLPNHISIIRANFPLDINDEDNSCFDGYGEKPNCQELSDRKLQIELDIIKSKDESSFYFQPKSYYYCGRDRSNKKMDELNLSFAFVTAQESISDYSSIEFKEIISFKDLEDEHDYNFKIRDKKIYDTTYQSAWIGSELSKKGSYTIVFKIEERRYSKPFAKTLNRIYKKHEDELKKKINKEIKEQITKQKK